MSFVKRLESALDGTEFEPGLLHTTHEGRPLWVRYDLDGVKEAVARDDLAARPADLWRYAELLPVEDARHIVSLGEGTTPLLDCPALAREVGTRSLLVKDESQLPTGSFKARGMAIAVSMAKELGVKRLAVPSAGNAGGALAAYAARADMECFVFMPGDTPRVNRAEAAQLGAKVFLVDGLIHHCAAIVKEGAKTCGWFDMSTLREPYRLEGKKTMGLELADQLGWRLPDVILYPTGGGTGLIGMWKAFGELASLGWLEDAKRPRMFACQAVGCAPIVDAHARGERFAVPPSWPETSASGIRVPMALGDFMILDALRESGGDAVAASEERLLYWMRRAAALEGISLCPESGACLAVLETALVDGRIDPDEEIVLFNTAAAQKYVELLPAEAIQLKPGAVDWTQFD